MHTKYCVESKNVKIYWVSHFKKWQTHSSCMRHTVYNIFIAKKRMCYTNRRVQGVFSSNPSYVGTEIKGFELF